MNLNLEDKYVLITGGCGAIGRTLAESFLEESAYVILADIEKSVEESKSWLADKEKEFPQRIQVLTCDVSDMESVKTMKYSIETLGIGIDILINNAGINKLVPALHVTEEDWDHIVDVNLKGTFFVSKYVAEGMIARGGGSIVNIASQHGVVGNVERAPYCSSKGGIVNLTKALCLEWAPYDIRVNSVLPTYVIHEKSKEFLMKPGVYRQYMRDIPMKRYCTTKDVAQTVLFLASSAAGMITGQNLAIDGGYLAR